MKYGFLLLLCMILIIPLAACGKKEVQTVRIGEVTRSIFYTPQYVAIAKGFFEEEGLSIELSTIPGGDKTMTALLSDGIDVALVGSETSIYVYAQGSQDPVKNFAALTRNDGTFLVSREPIENFSWDQLKGVDFLGQRVGGMPQMVGEYVLKKHGIDPKTDLNLIQNIDFANIAPAFASGTGKFVQLFEPTASVFELDGTGHVVASFGEESGELPYTSFMTKQSYIDKNKDTVEKFTKALYKAQQYVKDTDASEIAKAISPYFENTSVELIAQVIERYRSQSSFATDPLISEQAWLNLHDVMREAGQLPMEIPYKEIVTDEFAKKVIK